MKYPNFNKYFNRTSKTIALVLAIFNGVTFILSIFYAFVSGFSPLDTVSGFLYSIVTIGILVYLYLVQFDMRKARIGKKIMKNFANGDAERAGQMVDEIESELAAPVYSDVAAKRKNRNFIVTKNWVIGGEGRYLFRANAVRLDSIKEAEKVHVTVRSKGADAHYYELEIKDNNNVTYHFQLRNEESMEDAHYEVMSHRP